jgi:hypothetical protein
MKECNAYELIAADKLWIKQKVADHRIEWCKVMLKCYAKPEY